MDTTDATNLGYAIGWHADSSADFWGEYTHAIMSRLQAFAEAIREGRLPRTIRLTRIYYVINQGA